LDFPVHSQERVIKILEHNRKFQLYLSLPSEVLEALPVIIYSAHVLQILFYFVLFSFVKIAFSHCSRFFVCDKTSRHFTICHVDQPCRTKHFLTGEFLEVYFGPKNWQHFNVAIYVVMLFHQLKVIDNKFAKKTRLNFAGKD
jgi:hypothetical protein